VNTEILSTHTPELFSIAVQRAVELLSAGEVVALPTETVYGLAANALNAEAVAKIYSIKGRPSHNPIIVHVVDLPMAKRCVGVWPMSAERLAASFWPGPLTMVLPRANTIPDIVTAGGETVGVRWPAHLFIQAVIRACGFPLAAPSANLSNAISPTSAAHVSKQLNGKLRLIVDGGAAHVGIESAVIDLSAQRLRVLRPGMIHAESLAAAVGEGVFNESTGDELKTLRSPGMLRKHYSPKAKLLMLEWKSDAELKSRTTHHAPRTHVIAHTHIPSAESFAGVSVIPRDAAAFARAIYAELHRCDEAGADVIIVEALPNQPEWRGIADRLARAAAE
jgi:L-threonylcarbamoyladenylate synthase